MSVIKQISIFNGSNWDTPADIGANAENIDFTYTTGSQQGNTAALSSILPAQALTASRVLVTDSNGKLSSSSISSGILNTALSGASTITSLQSQINTLNTNLNIHYISSGNVDINTYQTTGKYYFGGEASLTNAPNGAVNGWLIVLQWMGSIKQLWFRYGSLPSTHKDFYFRTCVSYTWSDWIKVVDETYLQSANITS